MQSQHSQEVRQLWEQVEQRVPLGCVAELQQLLEREWCAAQQLRKECSLQEEKGRQLGAAGEWRQVPKGQLMVTGRVRLNHWSLSQKLPQRQGEDGPTAIPAP